MIGPLATEVIRVIQEIMTPPLFSLQVRRT